MKSLFSMSAGEMGGVLGSWIGGAADSGAASVHRPWMQSWRDERGVSSSPGSPEVFGTTYRKDAEHHRRQHGKRGEHRRAQLLHRVSQRDDPWRDADDGGDGRRRLILLDDAQGGADPCKARIDALAGDESAESCGLRKLLAS